MKTIFRLSPIALALAVYASGPHAFAQTQALEVLVTAPAVIDSNSTDDMAGFKTTVTSRQIEDLNAIDAAAHGATVAQNQWCEAVEKGTKGSVKCNLLPKAVSAPPGTFDAVRDGLADVSYTVDGYTPGRFVFTQVAEFPFLGDSSTATSVAYQRIYDKYFAPLGEHRGVKALAVFTHGPGIIFTVKQPVTSAAQRTRLSQGASAGVSSRRRLRSVARRAVSSRGRGAAGMVEGLSVQWATRSCV